MNEAATNPTSREDILRMAVDVVASYVSRNQIPRSQLPEVISTVFNSLNSVEGAGAAAQEERKPAVSVRRSVTDDYIVCLEDGKKLKMLKRYLRTNFDMTPEEYRAKWNLPADYPMVAPSYAKRRSDFAKKIGLGKKPGARGRKRSA